MVMALVAILPEREDRGVGEDSIPRSGSFSMGHFGWWRWRSLHSSFLSSFLLLNALSQEGSPPYVPSSHHLAQIGNRSRGNQGDGGRRLKGILFKESLGGRGDPHEEFRDGLRVYRLHKMILGHRE